MLLVQLPSSIACSVDEDMWLDSPDDADPVLVPSSDDPVDIKLVLFTVLLPIGGTPLKALVLAYIPLKELFCNKFSCEHKRLV